MEDKIIDYLSQLEDWQVNVFQEIHDFLISAHPGIQLKLKYGVPFFELRGSFIYFSYNKSQRSLVLGFTRGHLFQNSQTFLVADQGQTQVRHFLLHQQNPIDWGKLQQCVIEAIYWQEVLCKRCVG